MTEKGFKSFEWRSGAPGMEREIDLLVKSGRLLIGFDNYDDAVENLPRLAEALPEAKFCVCGRTSQKDIRFHEVRERFPKPIRQLDINRLEPADKEQLQGILSAAGLPAASPRMGSHAAAEMRDIVLAIYRNQAIAAKFKDAIAPALKSDGARFVIIASQLMRWLGVEISPAFLSKAGGIDAHAELTKHAEISSDIFKLEDGVVEPRSALLAEYLLEDTFTAEDIVAVCRRLLESAVERKEERRYRSLLGGLMQVSALMKILKTYPGKFPALLGMFEQLSANIYINQEPLFWLQYSILMMEGGNFPEAEAYLETSYLRAKNIRGFETYQIDTHSLRVYLDVEAASSATRVGRFEKIIDGIDRLTPLITDESHRYHVFRVLERIAPFVASRGTVMNVGERNSLIFRIAKLVQAMRILPDEVRVRTGSDIVMATLERASLHLVAIS